jgi:hypothetical protein
LLDHDTERAAFPLNGCPVDSAAAWVRQQFAEHGVDANAYTLAKHFTIPPHRVADSAPFDASADDAFGELRSWYSNSALVLNRIVERTPGASPVRCWPHHFDIATLLDVTQGTSPRKTISVGMEPGDGYYAEPYFYASMSPGPGPDVARGDLEGGGMWHSHEWAGAVLPGSRLAAEGQRRQVEAFIGDAIRQCTRMLLG